MSAGTHFPVWGGTAVVLTSQVDRLPAAVNAVQRTVQDFDLACSRFREDSELTGLNRAQGRPTRVSGLLREALRAGVRAAELTDGDVDPTLGRALVALGDDRDFAHVTTAPPAVRFASVPGWRTIAIDDAGSSVTMDKDVCLDLGATAKALAADHAAATAHAQAGCAVLVGLGGDLATAGAAPDEGWRVRVTDDHRAGSDAPGQWVSIRSGGLATSSTTVRRWMAGEEEVHHLLDPTTGHPAAGGWRTVSVAAGSCLDANIASTAAIVRGGRAIEWLRSLGLPSRLVSDDGRVIHLAGWTADGDDLPCLAGHEVTA
ncbi:MAG: FAD:protein FMN transferase [Actinomycetota bacterium]|nr:FAD:protein FMN transferase [Actinomycetota bacterium]